MSTSTIQPEPDTTGWLLEMTGNGDNIVCHAVEFGGRIIATAFPRHGDWHLVAHGVPHDVLPPLSFDGESAAIAWLTHLANLNTRSVA